MVPGERKQEEEACRTDHVLEYPLAEEQRNTVFCFRPTALTTFITEGASDCYATRSEDYFVPEPLASAIEAARALEATEDRDKRKELMSQLQTLSGQALSMKFHEQKYAIDLLLLRCGRLWPFEEYLGLYQRKKKEYLAMYPQEEDGKIWYGCLLRRYVPELVEHFVEWARDCVAEGRFEDVLRAEYESHCKCPLGPVAVKKHSSKHSK